MNWIFLALMGLLWLAFLGYRYERRRVKQQRHILRDLDVFGPSYGLDIVKRHPEVLRRGTIYVLLTDLEERRLVTSVEEAETPRYVLIPRRIYSITPLGRAEP